MTSHYAPFSAARVSWTENGRVHEADWRSESGAPPPRRIIAVDDSVKADAAYRLACEGTALLWRGDFQNARQLLQAMTRRLERRGAARNPAGATPAFPEAFHLHRQARAQRARILGMLLIPVQAGHVIGLRRAPDVAPACEEAHGAATDAYLISLRELLGLIGARQWREKGVAIAALQARIHPWYGVYSPVRGEYLDLVAAAPLPDTRLAWDIGTGTGVIAALLAHRGVAHIVATDQDPRALGCARENLQRLGLGERVAVQAADLFPIGRAALIVCNPPWIPARPSAPIEHAIYDPGSRMLRAFLQGLALHLAPGGEGWLILSDLAEHLALRSREELMAWFAEAGLSVSGRLDACARHPKGADANDPLYAARSREVTSLWRLRAA